MLTPYEFWAITGLRFGGERIKVNDFLTSKEIKSLLGVMPSKMKSKNVSLMWLYTNIENCKTVSTSTRMFMLLFIGTLLCPDLGSIMSLRYLWSLRDIGWIKNYDWGGMAYTTLLHFMTQLSWHSLSNLGGAPFVWQVRFWIFGYMYILESHFGCCITDDVCWFFLGLDVRVFWGWSLSFSRCWWYESQVSKLPAQVSFVNAFQAFFASSYGDW